MMDQSTISITTSLVICILKFREAIKAIPFAWETREWVQGIRLDLSPHAAGIQGKNEHLRRELNIIKFVFTHAFGLLDTDGLRSDRLGRCDVGVNPSMRRGSMENRRVHT